MKSVMKIKTHRANRTLRPCEGVAASELKHFGHGMEEFISLGLLGQSNGNFVLTRRGKSLADSITEAFL
jgi:hypothetical protein